MYETLLDLYYDEKGLVYQQIESYDRFITKKLPKIFENTEPIETNIEDYQLKFGRVYLDKPVIIEADGSRRIIYPMEARLRNLSYTAPLHVQITPVIKGKEAPTMLVHIGEIPVMLKSILCHLKGMNDVELKSKKEDPLDTGGYFIINGTEKVLIGLEDLAQNQITLTVDGSKQVTTAKVLSIRGGFRAKCIVDRSKESVWTVAFPTSPRDLRLVLVLYALGMTESELNTAFSHDKRVQNDICLNLALEKVKNTAEALDELGKKIAPGQPQEFRDKRLGMFLDNYLLPHLGVEEKDRRAKAFYLCSMANKTSLVAYHIHVPDDRDHYGNKRLKIAGQLMEELTKNALNFLIKDIKYQFERAYARGRRLDPRTIIRPSAFSDRINYSMATGNWVAGQTGVSSLLERKNMISAVSQLRRILSPLSRKHPHLEARDLHGTQWGKLCPNESPEGTASGLVKNLAFSCEVSLEDEPDKIEALIRQMGVKL